jgi:putative ABC transport system ATP-binding protein
LPDSVIDLNDVHLTLNSRAGPVSILQGVSFTVGPGESVAVIGPSGSGKSSLLMVMTGLERASRGRVVVAGHDLSALNEDGLARARGANMGVVFQSFHLAPALTALENVALPLEFLNRADAFDRARAALAEVGLSGRMGHYPAELSGGEQQRVALARALAPEPAILFADEPTGNLDGRTGAEIMDLIFALQKRHNATLVLITHDMTLANRCGRVMGMRDGRLEGAGAPGGGEVADAPSAEDLTAAPAAVL